MSNYELILDKIRNELGSDFEISLCVGCHFLLRKGQAWLAGSSFRGNNLQGYLWVWYPDTSGANNRYDLSRSDMRWIHRSGHLVSGAMKVVGEGDLRWDVRYVEFNRRMIEEIER